MDIMVLEAWEGWCLLPRGQQERKDRSVRAGGGGEVVDTAKGSTEQTKVSGREGEEKGDISQQ